jgi:hypothetical protein
MKRVTFFLCVLVVVHGAMAQSTKLDGKTILGLVALNFASDAIAVPQNPRILSQGRTERGGDCFIVQTRFLAKAKATYLVQGFFADDKIAVDQDFLFPCLWVGQSDIRNGEMDIELAKGSAKYYVRIVYRIAGNSNSIKWSSNAILSSNIDTIAYIPVKLLFDYMVNPEPIQGIFRDQKVGIDISSIAKVIDMVDIARKIIEPQSDKDRNSASPTYVFSNESVESFGLWSELLKRSIWSDDLVLASKYAERLGIKSAVELSNLNASYPDMTGLYFGFSKLSQNIDKLSKPNLFIPDGYYFLSRVEVVQWLDNTTSVMKIGDSPQFIASIQRDMLSKIATARNVVIMKYKGIRIGLPQFELVYYDEAIGKYF